MATQTTTTTTASNGLPAAIPMQYLPFTTEAGIPPPVSTGGIGSSDSSFTQANTGSASTLPPVSSRSARSNSQGASAPVLPSSSSRSAAGGSGSTSKAKSTPNPEPSSGGRVYVNTTIPMKISRIFDRFLVRMPHTFIAMAVTFIPLYYGLGSEWQSFACSATTFVGLGGTIYCFVRAFFFEVIPEWMLERTDKTKMWRGLMNVTYTGFITAIFTTAVWKLPDLSTIQGLFIFGVVFGLPYSPLSNLYLDIDKQPNWQQQKYGV